MISQIMHKKKETFRVEIRKRENNINLNKTRLKLIQYKE
jgi:hypothetical protein